MVTESYERFITVGKSFWTPHAFGPALCFAKYQTHAVYESHTHTRHTEPHAATSGPIFPRARNIKCRNFLFFSLCWLFTCIYMDVLLFMCQYMTFCEVLGGFGRSQL